MAPENVAAPKETFPPENVASLKPTFPPENVAALKSTFPPENVASLKSTWPPENVAPLEADVAAGERRVAEVECSVELCAGEVEGQALPADLRLLVETHAEVVGDQSHNRLSHFELGTRRDGMRRLAGAFLLLAFVCWVRDRRKSHVGAEDINAGLALLFPVVGKACERMNAGEPDSGLYMAELLGCRAEAFGKQPLIVAMALAFVDPVATIVQRQCDDGAETGGQAKRSLEDLDKQLALLARARRAARHVQRDPE